MAIFLIRHGETPGNRDRIIQFPDTPLSDRGLEQAARLGRRLADEPIEEIWVSDHTRAHQTAQAVERETRAPLRVVDELGERNLGALRGTPYAALDFDPYALDYEPPGGEGWPAFHDRVDRVWAAIERHWQDRFAGRGDAGHFCVVSHGLVLRSLFERRLLDAAGLARHGHAGGRVALANTAVSIVEPRLRDDGALDHHVALLACTAHLDAHTAPRANPHAGM